MQYTLAQTIIATLLLAVVHAKPPHFQELPQPFQDQQDMSNTIDTGLRPWQLELIAQRMAELNQIGFNGQDAGFERALRSANEIKRQSRYRQCYFNPVSCFRK